MSRFDGVDRVGGLGMPNQKTARLGWRRSGGEPNQRPLIGHRSPALRARCCADASDVSTRVLVALPMFACGINAELLLYFDLFFFLLCIVCLLHVLRSIARARAARAF